MNKNAIKTVAINSEIFALVAAFAKEHECSLVEAASRLITCGSRRKLALRKDRVRRAAGKPTKFRKVVVTMKKAA